VADEELGVLGARHYVMRHGPDLVSCDLAMVLDNLGGEGRIQVEQEGGCSTPATDRGLSRIQEPYLSRAWEGRGFPWKLLPPATLFAAFGNACHPEWLGEAFDRAIREGDHQVNFTGLQGSDQMAFAQAGIPTTGISAPNGSAHSPQDLPVSIHRERFPQCVDLADRFLHQALVRVSQSNQ